MNNMNIYNKTINTFNRRGTVMENEIADMHRKMCIVHIFLCIFVLNTL